MLPFPKPKQHFELQFATRGSRSFFLNWTMQAYSCGYNEFGQLGLGHTANTSSPTLLSFPSYNTHVVYITCGNSHNICLTGNNRCYVWGKNEYGQLGLGHKTNQTSPTELVPFQLPEDDVISFLICGTDASACVTRSGACYMWGVLRTKQSSSHPSLIQFPLREKVFSVSFGSFHLMCLTVDGTCYVWGGNSYGQLGLGNMTDVFTPTLLPFPNKSKVCFIACGANHCTCLTEKKECYVWGFNRQGQLGLGDTENYHSPTLLTLPNQKPIFYLQCGFNHTMCLDEDNQLYAWGGNEFGQLGLPDHKKVLTPTQVVLPNGEKVSHFVCSYYHTLCITQKNECYVWGDNAYGQLALGNRTGNQRICVGLQYQAEE